MKVKKINLDTSVMYTADSYPESGIFLYTDENEIKHYIYVNKTSSLVIYLDTYESGSIIFNDSNDYTQEKKEPGKER